MMYSTRYYGTQIKHSSVKIFKNNKNLSKKSNIVIFKSQTKSIKPTENYKEEYNENVAKIQMISRNLHAQIFKNAKTNLNKQTNYMLSELKKHNIDIESTERLQDVHLKLPQFHGENIQEHFYNIAKDQVKPYEKSLKTLINCNKLPLYPKKWQFKAGWTSYDTNKNTFTSVPYPDAKALVFDVEVCMSEGAAPTLATAVSPTHWYAWVSPNLIRYSQTKSILNAKNDITQHHLNELIPFGRSATNLVVGHNVSYDRARIQEQYLLEDIGVRFLDTMSLHMCVSGMTSYQRAMLKSKKTPSPEDAEWQSQSSLNSLSEVHKLYCGAEIHSKQTRNVFVEGTLSNVLNDFQSLMSYCANDVMATWRVLKAIYPLFSARFPHPATLAGMFEIGAAYLPVNSNWLRYINESNLSYEDSSIEAKYHLSRRADDACIHLKDDKYKQHLWLWNEDWSVQELKFKKATKKQQIFINSQKRENFEHLYAQKCLLPARRPLLPGYPAWYRKLCVKPTNDDDLEWSPGPTKISTGMQIAPKLLSLCWEGYPLHYLPEHGWGFLVPFRNKCLEEHQIPIEALTSLCPIPESARNCAGKEEIDWTMGNLDRELSNRLGKKEFWKKVGKTNKDHTNGIYMGAGVWCNIILDDCCYFLKLPHKNGNSFRVGNPLARDFLNKFSENVLSSGDSESGNSGWRVIEIARMMSYWRNNRDRIMSQLVVWLPEHYLSENMRSTELQYGAICPQIVASGTLTRRAMEATWLTASNSKAERIGSELRAMVQAPPGYKIVGADVDSQELWIASVLGDAHAYGEHGATPLGWMTLSGSKGRGTDMHSMTAKAVGISRDHAKVINYARIYGAGQNFAEVLLKQFNPTFSATEAKMKARKMFEITKGKRIFRLKSEYHDELDDKKYTSYEAMKIAGSHNLPISEMFERGCWQGGTESAMFNRLEDIALEEKPVTPFLNCRLSRALEVNTGDDESRFLPTRVNWVVQSGAVDFLHLMLVSMRWLMGKNVRFCISFHDEVRYMVKDELAYKAALAMHITNLLTRSYCSSRIGLQDLPMSVAFFTSVEVDQVLRKESTMDCKTPSNPHGLETGYGISPGKSLNIYEAIKMAGGNDLTKWEWISNNKINSSL